jgi:hypothetical protein
MKAEEPTAPERIGETFRNGSITGVGLLAGFSLSLMTTWSASPTRVGTGVAAGLAINIAPLSEGL